MNRLETVDFPPQSSVTWLDRLEPRLAAAIRLMEAKLEEPICVAQIALKLGLSTRSLELICKQHLGTSPGAYFLRLRLQAARRLVLDTKLPMVDISIRTGFSNPTSFSRAFKRRYQTTPLRLRNKSLGFTSEIVTV